MDVATRNRLQRATQQVRRVLQTEFADQLEGMYDILREGTILPEPGAHLDARGRRVRQKLADAIEHIRAGGTSPREAVEEYTREAAFTFLNRFVALRMLESRHLVQECVSKGDQSSGFKEFCGLAPGLADLPDGGYRLYLECLFDELSVEVRVLFDRHDRLSLLWPRRRALTDLLDVLGQVDLAGVWHEDETIGWVYQYFNRSDERKSIRKQSQTPRNRFELAVRNQFFTPRYVVEFLTDNTLGRIWYEMRRGRTRLADDCRYLVRQARAKKTDSVPYRPKKDPRDLKILDPACGSGHFLLYAFDLLITIYAEAWDDEESPPSDITGQRLRTEYPTREALHAALPRLVLQHNLHGMDIDPRAVQIAALALWMRGQRVYSDLRVARENRRPITRGNIVSAEPMPGGSLRLEEFIRKHLSGTAENRLLAQFVRGVVEEMTISDEAGSLLRVEDRISEAVAAAKAQWLAGDTQPAARSGRARVAPKDGERHFDVAGITGEQFWDSAEDRVYSAVREYAEHEGAGAGSPRRLFPGDAASGFAFIDTCRRRYDAIVMNPPFGDPPLTMRDYLQSHHPLGKHDLAAAFVLHALDRRAENGVVGVISTRTLFFLPTSEKWRRTLLASTGLGVFADLGTDVMDDAVVYAAAFTVDNRRHDRTVFIRGLDWPEKETTLIDAVHDIAKAKERSDVYCADLRQFQVLPGWVLPYWLPLSLTSVFHRHRPLGHCEPGAKQGIATADDFRFVRAAWEVPANTVGSHWAWHTKGGEFSPYYVDVNFVVRWADGGAEVKAFAEKITQQRFGAAGWSRWINAVDYYFRPGLTFTYRSRKFGVGAMPRGVVFGVTGMGVFTEGDGDRCLAAAALMNSTPFNFLLFLFCERRDPLFQAGKINKVPWPLSDEHVPELRDSALAAYRDKREVAACSELSVHFRRPTVDSMSRHASLRSLFQAERSRRQELNRRWSQRQREIDHVVATAYGFGPADAAIMESELAKVIDCESHIGLGAPDVPDFARWAEEVVSYFVGQCFGRWDNDSPMASPGSVAHVFSQPDGYAVGGNPRAVLVDDVGHPSDMVSVFDQHLEESWGKDSGVVGRELCEILNAKTIRDYLRKSFFVRHLKHYTKGRRKAPIYWQLATSSSSYSVWLYYHGFTKDTLFQVLNGFVKPKLEHERHKLDRWRGEAGGEGARSRRREREDQETFVAELAEFAEEMERLAPLWNPNLHDGVMINFAPLWRLIGQNKSWQRECKKVWTKLVAGDYDWAHLAMHLWPERVVPQCVTDASMAIAHGLQRVFWHHDDRGRFRPKEEPQGGWESVVQRLVGERTSASVTAALDRLRSAPEPAGLRGKRR